MRGRRPKPNVMELIRAQQPKRRGSDSKPKSALTRTPPAPAHLSKVAKAHWRKTAKHLHDQGLLTGADLDMLAVYCEAVATWTEAQAQLEEHGKVTLTTKGTETVSPWFRISREAENRMHRVAIEFGMTPAARTRVKPEPKTERGEFDDF